MIRGLPLAAQQPPPDTVRRIAELHGALRAAGPTIGPRIWPGFRPDTIPTLYVIPRQAKLFAQWRDSLPTGFLTLPGTPDVAWTDTRTVSFPRRPIAFLAVDSASTPGSVLGLALHEQFHAFQHGAARRGRRFGAGENAMIVATYPVFDVDNEAGFALEGKLLARALRARSTTDTRRLAREFLAVRERRQARLDSSIAEFETAAELNEGLAQYAMLRGLRELAHHDAQWRTAADAEARQESALLDSLLAVGPRSVRRRFYATGSTIAVLLDRLADTTWKERLVREDATLQQMLAQASGRVRVAGGRWEVGATSLREARHMEAELRQLVRDARRAVAALDARRSAQRDSLLAAPGLKLVVDPSSVAGRRLDWCGFDPQNVLRTARGELLHMRMLRVCAGPEFHAQFDQAVVEDRTSGELRAVIADTAALRLTRGGATIALPADGSSAELRDLTIESPTLTLVAARATLRRQRDELWVTPAPR